MIATLALAAALSAPAAAPKIPFERYTLPNGLAVILAEDHHVPVVAVDVWYHVGAVNEQPGKSGFAHLFEHLMFQGSKHVSGDERAFFGRLEKAGASFVNGSTEFDRTNYLETLPANQLGLALWLESDRMGFLLDGLDQKKLDTQRDVVRNERRQTTENVPYGRAEERLVQLLYPKPNPYYGAVIGSHEDLEKATLDDVKSFFKTYYTPNDASLAIVGDFDPAQAKALVEKYFAPIAPGPHKPAVPFQPQRLAHPASDTVKDHVQLAKVMAGFVGPTPLTADAAAMRVLVGVLSLGKSSRLFHDLVYDQKIAQDASASFDPALLGGEVEVTASVAPGHTPQEVEKALSAELARLRDEPPAADELARVKRNVLAGFYRRLESVGGFGGKADMLDSYEMWKGDPGYLTKDLAQLDAVTPEQVQAVAVKYLGDEERALVTVLPEERTASAK